MFQWWMKDKTCIEGLLLLVFPVSTVHEIALWVCLFAKYIRGYTGLGLLLCNKSIFNVVYLICQIQPLQPCGNNSWITECRRKIINWYHNDSEIRIFLFIYYFFLLYLHKAAHITHTRSNMTFYYISSLSSD